MSSRLIYNDHEKSFHNIWQKNLKNIHKSLEFFSIKIYKFQNDLFPPIMNIFIPRQNIYKSLKVSRTVTSTKTTVKFGTVTISYTDPELRNLIPENIKSEPTLELFKKMIIKWKCEPCQCIMWKPICNI